MSITYSSSGYTYQWGEQCFVSLFKEVEGIWYFFTIECFLLNDVQYPLHNWFYLRVSVKHPNHQMYLLL